MVAPCTHHETKELHQGQRCYHCRCTICGCATPPSRSAGSTCRKVQEKVKERNKTHCCVQCGSVTHACCVPSDVDMIALSSSSNLFYCSAFCLFGCSFTRTQSFDADASRVVEAKFARTWECLLGAVYASLSKPETSTPLLHARAMRNGAMRNAYLSLRYLVWRDYFLTAESDPLQGSSHCCLPPNWGELHRAMWGDLMSAEGQAHLLKMLDPIRHPAGSVVVTPNMPHCVDSSLSALLRNKEPKFNVDYSPHISSWNHQLWERTKRWLSVSATEALDGHATVPVEEGRWKRPRSSEAS